MIESIVSWAAGALSWLLTSLHALLVTVVNALITAIAAFGTTVLALLPTVSTSAPAFTDQYHFIGYLNWFLPVSSIVTTLGLYATAMVAYFTIGPLLRWVKLIK